MLISDDQHLHQQINENQKKHSSELNHHLMNDEIHDITDDKRFQKKVKQFVYQYFDKLADEGFQEEHEDN